MLVFTLYSRWSFRSTKSFCLRHEVFSEQLVIPSKEVFTCLLSQPHFGISVKVKPTLPKVGSWSLPGLLKTYSSISGVKYPRNWVFFRSLERSWSVDVQNDLAWTIWTSSAQVMGKRRAMSQTSSLTPDHQKSGIDLFPTSTTGVRHGVGKLSKRVTTLV
jgi:hypothetical protein